MSVEHEAANRLIQCYVDGDREGWKAIRDGLSPDIRETALSLEKRQRLMFEFDDYRYLGWCTVRPGNGKRSED